MPSSTLALHEAIFVQLTADAALAALLGGPRIYDDVPQGSALPYVTFAQTTTNDLGSVTEAGDEHIISLHVWSRAAGRKSTHLVLGRLRELLHDQPLTLAGHRLVNLRHEFCDARREPDGDTYRGTLRLRAVTEPL